MNAPASPPSLQQAFRDRFAIGCAIGGPVASTELALLGAHFGAITPENCMKPGPIHPEAERFDFGAADALVAFAEQHGLEVNGHCLVWHQQNPPWLFAGTSGSADPALLRARLEAHVDSVVRRYAGRIRSWDVVNEAVADNGEWLRDTPWLEGLGPEYLVTAFRAAHAADPGAVLYYNDYNIERPAKRARTRRLLEWLLERGAPVHGVGIQGHWQLDQVPIEDLEAAILEYHSLGLQVAITELDLDVVERSDSGADVSVHRDYTLAEDRYAGGCPAEVLARQAEQYGDLFALFSRHKTAIERVTFWGLHDGTSWLNYWPGVRTNHPLLFDRACEPKPAFHAVVDGARG